MPDPNATKECPLCGEHMRKKEFETAEKIPGMAEAKRIVTREWVCPECEYFEEIEGEEKG